MILVLSTIGGYLAMLIPAIGIGCLCIYSAYIVVSFIIKFSFILYLILLVILSCLFIFIAYKKYNTLVILGSSICGTYLTVSGIKNIIEGKESDDYKWYYLIGGGILILASGFYQMKYIP